MTSCTAFWFRRRRAIGMHSNFGPGPAAFARLSRLGLDPGFSPQRNFFFFLVRRNSANFASRACCKSFAGWRLESGSGAKLSEFRLGVVTKSPRGEALFAGR